MTGSVVDLNICNNSDVFYPWDGMRFDRKELGQWGAGFLTNKHGKIYIFLLSTNS